jgi:hypothetical protein
MICTECKKKRKSFKPLDLYMNRNTNCNRCVNIYDFIDTQCQIAHETYVRDIYNFLLENTPVKFNDNVIMANSKKYEIIRNDEDKVLKELILRLSLDKEVYNKKNDKISVLNKILGFLYDDFLNLVQKNPLAYLVSFMSNLEYNRFIAQNLVLWFCDEEEPIKKTKDDFVNILLDTLNFVKSFKVLETLEIKGSIRVDEIYSCIESQLALDEHSIEFGVEFLSYIINGKFELRDYDVRFEYGQALSIIRAINKIRALKVEVSEGIYQSNDLMISFNGEIKVNSCKYNIKNFASSYYKDMSSRKAFTQRSAYLSDIDNITRKYLGISLNQIIIFIDNIQKMYEQGDEFLVGDLQSWYRMIIELTDCSEDEAKLLLNNLVLRLEREELYKDVSIKRNRAARKCMIILEEMIICPVDLLKYSLMGTYIDIINADVANEQFRKELRITEEQEDYDFELAVFNEIKSNIRDIKIKANIGQKDIKVDKKYVILPGEIDVILLYNSNIFIIECKNSKLRTSPKSIANEYSKLSKENNKSVQIKLKNKIDIISDENNKNVLIEFMGDDYNKYINSTPIGIITTSNFSSASLDTELLFPIITWTNLCEWITKNYGK